VAFLIVSAVVIEIGQSSRAIAQAKKKDVQAKKDQPRFTQKELSVLKAVVYQFPQKRFHE